VAFEFFDLIVASAYVSLLVSDVVINVIVHSRARPVPTERSAAREIRPYGDSAAIHLVIHKSLLDRDVN